MPKFLVAICMELAEEKKLLINKSDKELENIVKERIKGKKVKGFDNLLRISFTATAAINLLTEKYGKKYGLDLLSLREPITRKEKIRYFFTGSYPKVGYNLGGCGSGG